MQLGWRISAILRQGLRVQVLSWRKGNYLHVSYRFAETAGKEESGLRNEVVGEAIY